jgi:hypothetical protein
VSLVLPVYLPETGFPIVQESDENREYQQSSFLRCKNKQRLQQWAIGSTGQLYT